MKNNFGVAIRHDFKTRWYFAEVSPVVPKAVDGIP
jgi:hypothetical protein